MMRNAVSGCPSFASVLEPYPVCQISSSTRSKGTSVSCHHGRKGLETSQVLVQISCFD